MRRKIEQTISDDHPVDMLFHFHRMHECGRVLYGEQSSFARQILIGEANQAHVNEYTNEKEDHVIQNGVYHSQTVKQVTLKSNYRVPLGYLFIRIVMAVVNAVGVKRVVRVKGGNEIVHFKLENLEQAKTQREKTHE